MTRIGLAGAGLIGQQHLKVIASMAHVTLAGVVDPVADRSQDLPWVADFETLLRDVDGVILATPNDMHAPMAIAALQAGVPVLVEKPLASSAEEGAKMVMVSGKTGVPLLVGHHRRHSPLVTAARDMITAGDLGQLTTLHGQCWLPKPDTYFKAAWRQTKGAGPLFINLIHDVDLLMYLCGPISRLQAMQSNALRGAEVEDTVVVTLQFASGQLGTLNLSDAALGPWSWELTAGENPAYPKTDQTCYVIGGTKGSLALPNLTHWHQKDGPDWWAPISATRIPYPATNPLTAQLAHFVDVIAGRSAPLVSGNDGLRALQVIEAIKQAATTGRAVALPKE